MTELRPYQVEIIDKVRVAIAGGHRRVLMVLPTGGGKMVLSAAIIGSAVGKGKRALFLAHRRELIQQSSQKLYAVGVDHGIIQAGFPIRPDAPVQVASVQTLYARAVRSSTMDMPDADVVICDEAHHGRARSYQRIFERFPDAVVVGMTATPCRGDGRGLGSIFDVIVEGPSVADLVRDGYLVASRVYAPSIPDLDGVKVERGDYVEKQLEAKVNTDALVGDVILHWFKLADRRPTVVFAVGVAHSVHLRDEFRKAGVSAEHIDGNTPVEERDHILAQLAKGAVEVVCNCAVLTEGWDSPQVSCIVLARPTKSVGLYRQMVGRVLRPAPGKLNCTVLDHAGAVFEHGFVDEPIEWTLKEDERARNPRQEARKERRVPKLVACPECASVMWQGQPCGCGWRPREWGRSVDVLDGDLAEVGRDRQKPKAPAPTMFDKQEFYSMLDYVARERGYKPGWAANQYREKFKVWPNAPGINKYADPIPPDEKMRSWIRSRQIRYAKAREKQRATG
jgi:DNA repair protein RadD